MLTDYRTVDTDEKLRATLAFLEKAVLERSEVTPADARCALYAGVSAEALGIMYCFGVMTRFADAFDFTLPTGRSLKVAAKILLGPGYPAAVLPG